MTSFGEVLIGKEHALKVELRDYKRRPHAVVSFTANAMPLDAAQARAFADLMARAADELEQPR